MKRTFPALLAALALVVPTLALGAVGTPAAAAPDEQAQYEREYWFGTVSLDHAMFGDSGGLFTSLDFEHPERAYPLPFHSVARATLYDCDGKVAYRRYGNLQTVKEPGKPWRTDASVDLNVPPKGGPFSHWAVTLRSKGHKQTRFRVTDGGFAFRLGCDGEYRRHKDTFWSTRYEERKPINAQFRKSVRTILAAEVRSFGRPTGRARVGSTVNVVGAKDRRGRPDCGVNLEISWPGRPALESHAMGISCGSSYGMRIEPKAYFRKYRADGTRRNIVAPARGKHLMLSTNFYLRGHNYIKEFDRGIIR